MDILELKPNPKPEPESKLEPGLKEIQAKLKYLIQRELEETLEIDSKAIYYIESDLRHQNSIRQEGLQSSRSTLLVEKISGTEFKTVCFQPRLIRNYRDEAITTQELRSEPIQENDAPLIFKEFEEELRERILNTASFPNSVHGLVRIKNENESNTTGTGILIGTNLVLTAAHNIYDSRGTKKKFDQIEFIPGINDQIMPFGKFQVIETYVPDEYLRTWKDDDYGLLVLDGNPGLQAGYFGLHVAESQNLVGNELNVVGYPGYVRSKDERNKLKQLSGKGRHQLWGMKGNGGSWFFDINEGESLINYNILTTPGQSGSGVFYHSVENNKYYVIGIHVRGGYGKDCYNTATWITKERFDKIVEWVILSRRNLIDEEKSLLDYKVKGDKIKKLDLEHLLMGDLGLELIVENAFPNIEKLNLTNNVIARLGAKLLTERTNWKKLTVLNLSRNKIGTEGAAILSKNTSWIDLASLDLSWNKIGANGAAALSRNTSWVNLTSLDLSWNRFGAKGAAALSQNISWINLISLNLSDDNIRAEGAADMSKNTSWVSLTSLDLSYNNIGAGGVAALSRNTSWINLTNLDLSKNKICRVGAVALSKNISWIKLTNLDLSFNEINSEGAAALSKNTSWKISF